MHYGRWRETGDVGIARSYRTTCQSYRQNGYVYVRVDPGHPFARRKKHQKQAYIAEHRLVVEGHLGRPLEPHENVHHKNGVRDDNRIENLELWVKPQPCGQRPSDLVEWVVEHYPELVEAALSDRSQLRLAI
jgi:hypothetical protein